MSERLTTEALISRLANDLRPVTRLASPLRRAALLLMASLWLGLLLSLFTDWHGVAFRLLATPDLGLSEAGAVATAILAGISALQSAVPGRSRLWPLVPLPALAVWFGASLAGCVRLHPAAATVLEPPMHPMLCVEFMALVSAPLSGLLVWQLGRAFPVRPDLTAGLGGLASAAAAASLLTLIHPFDATRFDLLAHAAAVVLIIVATRFAAATLLSRGRE